MVAYKRPRVAAAMVAGAALLTAPYLGFLCYNVARWTRFAGWLAGPCSYAEALAKRL